MPPKQRSTSKSSSTRKKEASSTRKRQASSTVKNPESKKVKGTAVSTIFPVDKIHRVMEQKLPGGVVKPEAALFLTAVMEYLAAEIMEQSINVARSRMNTTNMAEVRLTTNDVDTALENDPELKQLMDRVRGHHSSQDAN